MAKKEKPKAKANAAATKGEAASSNPRKTKKDGKDRFKGKGKWAGDCGDGDDLGMELAALGLRIKDITGDGNCFFRALGDQLQGDERQHEQLRQRVVSYMLDNQDDFAPFVEDDESFDSYVARMKKDGVWAGYMEVVAASHSLGANLTIYQAGQPRWRVINHSEDTAPMLHLSYHDGQHYNSVRCADDFGAGPPEAVLIRGDGTMGARRPPPPPTGDGSWDERDERRVATSTACTDMALVRKALEEARGDVEAAVERVIEALAAAEEPDVEEPGAGTTSAAAAEPLPSVAEVKTTPAAASRGAEVSVGSASRPTWAASGRHALSEPVTGGGDGGDWGMPDACGVRQDSGRDDTPAHDGGDGGGGDASRQEPADAAMAAAADDGVVKVSDGSVAAAAAASAPAAAGKPVRVGGVRVAAATRRTTAGATAAAAAPSNNKRCPCGSGKKYKACCGPAAAAAERRRAAAAVPGGGAPDGVAITGSDGKSGAAAAVVVVAQVAALVL